ncbi:MAG: preprotein translocase subunit SecE [Planctomycetes bacterium]|nr:preprotein translocase subunit SecE [Planctomycetota bacterium]
MIITIVVLAVCGVAIHLVLNRPKSADLLIDTEAELRKVTWPTGSETWNGTVAVVITVAVMLFYLAFADFLLAELLTPIMTVGPN